MTRKRKVLIWVVAIALAGVTITGIIVTVRKRRRISLQGAVVRQDSDPNKQSPVANAEVKAITGSAVSVAKSDSSGFFRVTLPRGFRRKQAVTLQFSHPDYQPLELKEFVSDKLYLARMTPVEHARTEPSHAQTTVTNVRVRYSVKTTTEAEVGSAVKTFQVTNAGDVPCNGRPPCSPDGKWRATIGSTSLDAGEGNAFRNVRVSCIAGPCPFTKVELEGLSQGNRHLAVAVRDWSDSATFLVEAAVVHPMVSDLVRESYPVVFGQTLSFSLPAGSEGPSIEAEINQVAVIFPLGPDLYLSWAHCTLEIDKTQTQIYRCELKPGYRFG